MPHNENFTPRSPNITKQQYNFLMGHRGLGATTSAALREKMLDKSFSLESDFVERAKVSGFCTPGTYYRKMSAEEFDKLQPNDPFSAAFAHTDTKLYRYWMSSSLKKVRAFGNENSTSDDGVIIKFEFKVDFRKEKIKVEPHQKKNVQAEPKVIAMHREGFAVFGNCDTDEIIQKTIEEGLDHNLGFTSLHKVKLVAELKQWTKM